MELNDAALYEILKDPESNALLKQFLNGKLGPEKTIVFNANTGKLEVRRMHKERLSAHLEEDGMSGIGTSLLFGADQ